jgi:hypothetical protein
MNKQAMDWFTSLYSNTELAHILSDYSKDVYGQRPVIDWRSGRCTLVNELEQLDAVVARMPREQRVAQGWLS